MCMKEKEREREDREGEEGSSSRRENPRESVSGQKITRKRRIKIIKDFKTYRPTNLS